MSFQILKQNYTEKIYDVRSEKSLISNKLQAWWECPKQPNQSYLSSCPGFEKETMY